MTCYYTTLPGEALLHISGPDTLTFLQGQTTCDTGPVDATRAASGAYCTPQGRVVCDFLLAQLGAEHFGLRMRRDIRAHAAAVFGKYIVFSKAEVDAEREDWAVAAVWGEGAAGALEAEFGGAPATPMDAISGEDFAIVRTAAGEESFEVFFADGGARLDGLAATAADEAAWQRLQIEAGIARIEAPTVETFVPQVLNYDLTGHISFTKGCYTGQEVVARLHYRGKSKRRCYRADLPGSAAAAPGADLYLPGGQAAGEMVNSVAANGNGVALVTATEEALAQGLHLDDTDGPRLSLERPPYPLEDG